MEITMLTGYILAVLVGISLGLIGSGGSILTVPVLVYVMGINPILATAYSLFIVGITSLVGGIQHALRKKVDFKTVFVFGIPSIAAVYFTRAYLLRWVPEVLFELGNFEFTKSLALMLLFALVMVAASISMIRPCSDCDKTEEGIIRYNYPMIFVEGILVGTLTGLVGAGGGFLIIPALVLLARIPMKQAIGTSLFIIAIKSLTGFAGDVRHNGNIDWLLLSGFTLLSVIGIFIGIFLSKRIAGHNLRASFGWFVLLMGIYILVKELFL